jgi:hypothetical protein
MDHDMTWFSDTVIVKNIVFRVKNGGTASCNLPCNRHSRQADQQHSLAFVAPCSPVFLLTAATSVS